MGRIYLRGGGRKKPDFDPDLVQDEDEFEIVIDKRHRFTGAQNLISANSKLGRIVLYSETYRSAVKRYGKDFGYVQLLRKSKTDPTKFWIRPCTRTEVGSRRIHIAAGSRIISAKLLLKAMGIKADVAIHFTSTWDERAGGLVVDISHPLEV
jgi:hypothetical protein